MIIIIGSAGRRLYLIRWFREAFEQLGIEGRVIVTESDPTSASFTYADDAFEVPRYSDSNYENAMVQLFEQIKPDLLFSVNDYELDMLAGGLAAKLRKSGAIVVSLDAHQHQIVSDKYRMAHELSRAGVLVPETVLGNDYPRAQEMLLRDGKVIIKHRFGSGSSGLSIISSVEELKTEIAKTADIPGSFPVDGVEAVIVQKYIAGIEYGIDAVAPLDGAKELSEVAVLARQKLRMRAGETDKAITVDGGQFTNLGQRIALHLGAQGLIDIDCLISEADGLQYVIDINPRFGGGYPFMHMAGADVPRYYVDFALGIARTYEGKYKTGVTSAKYEEIRISD